jgi:hypothetical protein
MKLTTKLALAFSLAIGVLGIAYAQSTRPPQTASSTVAKAVGIKS